VEKRFAKNNPSQQKMAGKKCDLCVTGGGTASLTRTTMYASTWRNCHDDKEPVAYDYGEMGIYNTVFCGGFSKHWYTKS
jgi:hypothetical protein